MQGCERPRRVKTMPAHLPCFVHTLQVIERARHEAGLSENFESGSRVAAGFMEDLQGGGHAFN